MALSRVLEGFMSCLMGTDASPKAEVITENAWRDRTSWGSEEWNTWETWETWG